MSPKTTRRIDDQGRVILPHYIRKALNIVPGNNVEVTLDDDGGIRVRVVDERCNLCGESVEGKYHTEVTIGSSTKRICPHCIQAVAKAIMK